MDAGDLVGACTVCGGVHAADDACDAPADPERAERDADDAAAERLAEVVGW